MKVKCNPKDSFAFYRASLVEFVTKLKSALKGQSEIQVTTNEISSPDANGFVTFNLIVSIKP